MMTINKQTGKKIRLLRKERGLTQEEFGKLFNISQNRVTNIETGKSLLRYDELLSMAQYFNVSTDFILKENSVGENNSSEHSDDGRTEKALSKLVDMIQDNYAVAFFKSLPDDKAKNLIYTLICNGCPPRVILNALMEIQAKGGQNDE